MIPFARLPALNAVLNGTSAVLLGIGFVAIRRRHIRLHRACMLAAFTTSIIFLASYVTYHLHAGTTRFTGQGWVRPVYFTILGTHTFLAALIPPLAAVTLGFALAARFTRHARLARWTLPAWLYVSVTGVVIYFLLYWIYPDPRLRLGSEEAPRVSPATSGGRRAAAGRAGAADVPETGAATGTRTSADSS